jgi:hypothetical protein
MYVEGYKSGVSCLVQFARLEEPMIKLRCCLPLIPLVLSSCATPPPAHKVSAAHTGSHLLRERTNDPSSQCFSELSRNPELQILKGKVSFPESDYAMGRVRPTREMLSSSAMPSDAEKSAISTWSTAANECWNSGADWRTKYYPDMVNSEIDKHVTYVKALVTDLSAGKISYGEYARTWTAEASNYKKDIVAIARSLGWGRDDNWMLGMGASSPMGGYPLGNMFH